MVAEATVDPFHIPAWLHVETVNKRARELHETHGDFHFSGQDRNRIARERLFSEEFPHLPSIAKARHRTRPI